MRTLVIAFVVFMMAASLAHAAPKTKKQEKVKPAPPQTLTMSGMEIGQTGILVFGNVQTPTLLPLKIEDVEEGRFVGSITSSMTGKRTAVIVRGVKTDGLISGRYFQLNGLVRVAGTEEVSDGQTVFVLEPVDPDSFTLKRSNSPDLEQPR